MRASRAAMLACLVAVAGIWVGGCTEGQRYADDAQGYVIRFPDGWKIKQDALGRVTAFAPKGESEASETFISIEKDGVGQQMNAKQYRDREMYEEEVATVNERGQPVRRPGFNKVLEKGETTLAGQDAAWATYSFNIGEVEMRAISYFVTDGSGRGFRVNGVTMADQFDKWRATFEKAAQTLEIMPPPEKV